MLLPLYLNLEHVYAGADIRAQFHNLECVPAGVPPPGQQLRLPPVNVRTSAGSPPRRSTCRTGFKSGLDMRDG
jgi:hypothetical protein